MTGLIIFGSLLIGMFMGLPVCFALLAACLIYLIPSGIPLTIVPQTMIAGMNSFVLLAIPLFTMTGYLMEQTSLSRRLVDFVEALFCRSRGSMGVVTIVTCAIFAALTGSGPATVAAIGAIMMPALTRANYPKSTSAGMIAAGGALGPIIPPSANMVVYGAAMGLAFQVVDDILDVVADSATLGKTAGKDAAADKPTYVSLLGLDRAQAHAQELLAQAHAALARSGLPDTRALTALADMVVRRSH